MTRAVAMLVFFLTGCATNQHMNRENVIIHTEIAAPELSTVRSFGKSKGWLNRHLHSKRNIIDFADEETGVIIASGTIDYPAQGDIEAIDRIQYTISFTMREDIKEGGISITFYDLLLNVPKSYLHSRLQPEAYSGGYSIPVENRSDYEAAKRGLLELTSKLADYLKR
jgi:hypothetical protein